MTIHTMEQHSPEWTAVRGGKFTASTFSSLFAKETTKEYQNLINQVVFERLTGETPESFESDWMKRGTELEPQALKGYEMLTFNTIRKVGFIELSEWTGCSPDGLIGEDGLVQIKCPKWSTLINYHLTGEIPRDYMIQMQGELFVTGRKWNDFFVYHPKLKPILKRVDRDEKMIDEIIGKLEIVIAEAKKRIERIG